MKLFSLPDGTIDRKDRAQWLSCPFDLAFNVGTVVAGPYRYLALDAHDPGAVAMHSHDLGAIAFDTHDPGAVATASL